MTPLSGVPHLARRAGAALLDLVYPPSCLVCRKAVAAHGALCPDCWREIAFIERPYCERLGTPFEHDLAQPGLISLEAAANPPAFGRARAVARYDSDKARLLAHRLKYYDRLELAEPIGRWMARAGAELLGGGGCSRADPAASAATRGAALQSGGRARACRRAAKRCAGRNLALTRVKPTAPQVGLSRAQRAANLAGAFRVAPERAGALQDRNVVLVDDVLTTGATANAATRAVLKAGAARVDLLVFARAVTSA